jgi:RHS repeat-associated protein
VVEHGTSTNTGSTNARQYIGQYTDNSGLSYLNARYYASSQGQFTSEDPVFLGTQQNLGDPQSLNAYSYSEDNPIIKEDPSGNCPQCALAAIGAGAGIAGQYGVDVFHNYQQNGLTLGDFYSGLSGPQTYLLRAFQGAVIGATGGAASAEVFGSNLFVQSAVVGGVSGLSGVAVNHALGEPITAQSVLWDTGLGAFTFGLSELAPAVRGVSPSFGTRAFYMGALNWSRLSVQKFRVDKWSLCRG